MTVNCKLFDVLYRSSSLQGVPGADLGEDCRVAPPDPPPPPKMTCDFLIQLVFCKKKKALCFICVEVNHETRLKNKNGSPQWCSPNFPAKYYSFNCFVKQICTVIDCEYSSSFRVSLLLLFFPRFSINRSPLLDEQSAGAVPKVSVLERVYCNILHCSLPK